MNKPKLSDRCVCGYTYGEHYAFSDRCPGREGTFQLSEERDVAHEPVETWLD